MARIGVAWKRDNGVISVSLNGNIYANMVQNTSKKESHEPDFLIFNKDEVPETDILCLEVKQMQREEYREKFMRNKNANKKRDR